MKRFHAYKVLQYTEEGRLISAMGTEHSNSIFSLEYFPNKYIYPIIGMLFAFSELEFAYGFAGNYSHNPIFQFWDCLTTKNPIEYRGFIPIGKMEFEAFWDNYPKRLNSDYMRSLPSGTVLCEDLKLWKRIS